jgi:hypothetical protein
MTPRCQFMAFVATVCLGWLGISPISVHADSPQNFTCVLPDHQDRGFIHFTLPTTAVVRSPVSGTFSFSLAARRAMIFEADLSADPIVIQQQSTGTISFARDPDHQASEPFNLSENATIPFSLALTLFSASDVPRSTFFNIPVVLHGSITENGIFGSLSGVLPAEAPHLGNSSFTIAVSCRTVARSRFKAHFSFGGTPHAASVTISDGIRVKRLEGVTDVDEVVPSKATYSIQWAIDPGRPAKDVFDLLILPNEVLELNFRLFRPGDVATITPVILAEEVGADAAVLNFSESDPETGIVQLTTLVGGKPDKLVILDIVLSRSPVATANAEAFAFQTGVLAILGCAHSGFPPARRPTREPCSSTDDDMSCDVNLCATLPSTGTLTLFDNVSVRELRNSSQIVLAAALRNSATIDARSFFVKDAASNQTVESSQLNKAFEVPPGAYVYSFEVAKELDPDDTYRLEFPISTSKEQIRQIAAFPPKVTDLRDFTPIVVGDSHLGLGTKIIAPIISTQLKVGRIDRFARDVRVDVNADDVGWVLVPLPKRTFIKNILKVHSGITTELTERDDFTIGSVDRHTLVVIKADQGDASYIIRFFSGEPRPSLDPSAE